MTIDELLDAEVPPAGNTGGNQTGHGLKVDGIRGTFPRPKLDCLVSLLEGIYGKGTKADRGISGYSQRIDFPTPGLLVAWSEDRPEAFVNVPGRAFDALDAGAVLDLLHFLGELGLRPSRLDLAFDDFEGLIPMGQVHAAGQSGNFIGFRKYRNNQEWDGGKLTGDTAYFGSRGENGSGKFIRFYNKTMQTGGESAGAEHDHNRYEVEASADIARQVFVDLTASTNVEEMTRTIAKFLGGAITFAERHGLRNGNTSRFERAEWWVRILDILGAVKYRSLRGKTTLQQKLEWVKKQVIPTLAKIKKTVDRQFGIGRQFLNAMIETAESFLDQDALNNPENQLPIWIVRREIQAGRRGPFRAADRLAHA